MPQRGAPALPFPDAPTERGLPDAGWLLPHLAGMADRIALFLDFDGTLAPIVARPEDAAIPKETQRILAALSRRIPVAILSGRDRADVAARVGLVGIDYAGSHGLDIAGPHLSSQRGEAFLPALDAAEAALAEALAPLPGIQLERKRYAISIHSRRATEEAEAEAAAISRAVLAQHAELRLGTGKKVLELRPDLDWHKGKAMLALLDALPGPEDRVAVFLGDDVTDEDGFRALCAPARPGYGIRIGEAGASTAARFILPSVPAAAAWLGALKDRIADKK